MISYNSELYHYGVKGMKWGVRKKRDKARQKNESKIKDYKTAEYLKKKVRSEGNKLLSSNPSLKKDFGGLNNWDDDSYLEYVARGKGINTDAFWNAVVDRDKFVNENRKSINKGKKLARKLGID